jgi:arylsulfatase A-like enzyme
MRRLPPIAALAGIAVLSLSVSAAPAAPDARPHLVIILTDDQRGDTLQYMPLIRQHLVARGVLFPNGFVTTPLCCPSRASLLSGQYAHHTEVLTNQPPLGGASRFKDASTLATWLRAAGYHTGLFGKYLNGYGSLAPYVPPGWDEWNAFLGTSFFNYSLNENGTIRRYGRGPAEYATEVLARKAVGFIERTPAGTPLLVYFAPFAPHAPATPAPQDADAFMNLAPWRPPAYNEADVRDKPAWVQRLPMIEGAGQAQGDEFRRKQVASLQAVDRAVGALVEALRRTGRLDQTVFVFTADNGLSWGEHRWLNRKSCPYEECIRVPFVVVVPGVAPRSDPHFALNIDVAPTLAELAGVRPAGRVDGLSLVPLLRNPAHAWREAFIIEYWGGAQEFVGVRAERWTYVEYASGERELYDLAADPYQLQNVAADPAQAAAVARLRAQLEALRGR